MIGPTKHIGAPTTVAFNEALKDLGLDPETCGADEIVPRAQPGTRGTMWDAGNRERHRSGLKDPNIIALHATERWVGGNENQSSKLT